MLMLEKLRDRYNNPMLLYYARSIPYFRTCFHFELHDYLKGSISVFSLYNFDYQMQSMRDCINYNAVPHLYQNMYVYNLKMFALSAAKVNYSRQRHQFAIIK